MRRVARTLGWTALGLLIGAGLGLYLGWVVWPAEFSDIDPARMSEPQRQDYARMIATAYAGDRDLASARWRVATLDAVDPNGWLLAFTVDTILAGEDETVIRRLVALANDLGLRSPAMEPYLPGAGAGGPAP